VTGDLGTILQSHDGGANWTASGIPTHSRLSIMNMDGQELITCPISEPQAQLDISVLQPGIYIVRLIGEKGVEVAKLIKQ